MDGALKKLSRDAAAYGYVQVEELDRKPTPVEFAKLVGRNRPAVFRGEFFKQANKIKFKALGKRSLHMKSGGIENTCKKRWETRNIPSL